MTEKRFNTLNIHYRDKFGEKVMKVSLDGGFTCPNRDGKITFGGCTFCSAEGSGDFAGRRVDSIATQFSKIKERMHEKWKNGKYIAYFQAFSNTYAPVEVLKEKFEPVLLEENVVGISIGTRPDCLQDDVVEYLGELNKKTFLYVELGLQTVHPHTAKRINRGYDYATFVDAVERLRKQDINVCVHLINGLPGETPEMMLETVKEVSKLDIQGVKLHLLHLLKDTPVVKQYERGELVLMEKDEYISLICDQIEILPPDVIIHRLTGDGPRDLLIGPLWSLKKWEVLNAIDDELKKRDTFQGRLFGKE